MFTHLKDTALAKAVRIAINNHIKEYGSMLKLNLNSDTKSIEMEIMLDGEKEPLAVQVKRYNMIQENGRHFLEVQGVRTSRAWINVVASTYLEGKRFEIPAEYAAMLKVIV